MDKKRAEDLIYDYFQAWETRDRALFSSTLDFSVKVTENSSETEKNICQCEESFENWCDTKPNNADFVVKDIIYDEADKKATVFWELHMADDKTQIIDSNFMVIKFHKGKIKQMDRFSLDAAV